MKKTVTVTIAGNSIPVTARATYYPRRNLRTPPALYLEWEDQDLFLTGEKANNARSLFSAFGGTVDMVISTSSREVKA